MQPDNDSHSYWPAAPDSSTPPTSPYEQPLPDVADPGAPETPERAPAPGPISWRASEYIHHEKQFAWYAGLAILAVALVALAIIMEMWTFAVLIVVMAVALIYLGIRPPAIVTYQLSADEIMIDNKRFEYRDFRSFGILQDGPLYSVVLAPNKRFMPTVKMYFPQELGEGIVDLLGARLPLEPVEQDFMDRLMRKLRF